MVCRHCGGACEDGAAACSHCGRPLTDGENGWFLSEGAGPAWPDDGAGRPAQAVQLVYAQNPMDIGLKRSLLQAFGIPTRVRTPNPTFFSNVLFGAPIYGAEIFVPEPLLEAARDVLEASMAETEEEMP
ncbi:MAG: DUF2007 domain-containing protein [Oscillospiraceae bacterium]|jgi:hypothetical protein|nr:DUF2007 domain-containing protein [Oscillospiraceae bacterium]